MLSYFCFPSYFFCTGGLDCHDFGKPTRTQTDIFPVNTLQHKRAQANTLLFERRLLTPIKAAMHEEEKQLARTTVKPLRPTVILPHDICISARMLFNAY